MAKTMASPVKNDRSPRKNKKPLMEKKRRARINDCLDQLKVLLMHTPITETGSQGNSKMEKADILEMTVQQLRQLQKQHEQCQDLQVVSKYRAGFRECAVEVARCLASVHNLKDEVKTRMREHLTYCLQAVDTADAPFAPELQRTLNLNPLAFRMAQQQHMLAPLPLDRGHFPAPSSAHASALDSSRPSHVTVTQPVCAFPPQQFVSVTAPAASSVVVPAMPSAFTLQMPGAGAEEMATLMAGVSPTPPSFPVEGVSVTPVSFLSLSSQSQRSSPDTSPSTLPRPSSLDISHSTVSSPPLDLAMNTTPTSASMDSDHTRTCTDSVASSSSQCSSSPSSLADKLWRPW